MTNEAVRSYDTNLLFPPVIVANRFDRADQPSTSCNVCARLKATCKMVMSWAQRLEVERRAMEQVAQDRLVLLRQQRTKIQQRECMFLDACGESDTWKRHTEELEQKFAEMMEKYDQSERDNHTLRALNKELAKRLRHRYAKKGAVD